MTSNTTQILFGAVSQEGSFIFSSYVDTVIPSNWYNYDKILSFQDKILFINEANSNAGLIVGINSTNNVVFVLQLSTGANNMTM